MNPASNNNALIEERISLVNQLDTIQNQITKLELEAQPDLHLIQKLKLQGVTCKEKLKDIEAALERDYWLA